MYDASDFALGAVLGQRRNKIFQGVYNASQTLNDAQQNYTTEKELLVVVFTFDKFRSYLIGFKVIVSQIIQPSNICLQKTRPNQD